jgi:hypothetical protein
MMNVLSFHDLGSMVGGFVGVVTMSLLQIHRERIPRRSSANRRKEIRKFGRTVYRNTVRCFCAHRLLGKKVMHSEQLYVLGWRQEGFAR